MVRRVLVTTAIEETWPSADQPVLFLGEWCRLYSRKDQWEKRSAVLAPYHWDDRKKLADDYRYLSSLYETVLQELSLRLNAIHGVDHSVRYWRILVGPWLGYFMQMLFDRWFMLKRVIDGGAGVVSCRVLDRDELSVIPNDMADFHRLFPNDDWNEAMYAQLMRRYWADAITLEGVACSSDSSLVGSRDTKGRDGLKETIKSVLGTFSKVFSRDQDYFFISSYLPLQFEVQLQMRLGQAPALWQSAGTPRVEPSAAWRAWSLGTEGDGLEGFDKVAREMIPGHIPTAYLEGYEQLRICIDALPWPSKPKAMFTSNSYSADDVFKCWAGDRVESGVPLVIGQHGGNFGMTPFAFYEDQQISIADKWFSWGWADAERPNVLPVGNLKGFGGTVPYDKQGGALMVEMTMPRYSYYLYSAPIAGQYLDYLDDQMQFISALSHELQQQVLLRLYHHDYGCCQQERWMAKFPDIRVDDGSTNIRALIRKSRLYISTYNATTYLESLSWNVPTIMFWNPQHWELKDEVQPYFDQLKSVGIFHETPESAARQMEAVWDDVDEWWHSSEVQEVRRSFCERFAHIPSDPMGEMVRVLQEC